MSVRGYYGRVFGEAFIETLQWFGKGLIVRASLLVLGSLVVWRLLPLDEWIARVPEILLYPGTTLVAFFLLVYLGHLVYKPVKMHAAQDATIEALRREFPSVEISWGSLPRAFRVPKQNENELSRGHRFIVINSVTAISRSTSPVSIRLRLTLLLPKGERFYFEAWPSSLRPWETEREKFGEANTDPLPHPVDLASPGSRTGYVAFVIDGGLQVLLNAQTERPFEVLTWGLHVEDLIGRTRRQITAFGIELHDLVERPPTE